MIAGWRRQGFTVATKDGPIVRDGFTYRGLGVHLDGADGWALIHLNTGHAICWLDGPRDQVFHLAEEVAECGDWSFRSLTGVDNLDPGLVGRARRLLSAAPIVVKSGKAPQDEFVARQIARARAE